MLVEQRSIFEKNGLIRPWARVGTELSDSMSVDEMLARTGLDWLAEQVPLHGVHNGQIIKPNVKSLVRATDSKILSDTTEQGEPIQNRDVFMKVKDFAEVTHSRVVRGGQFNDGTTIWVVLETNERIEPVEGDIIQACVLFTLSHVYGKTYGVRVIPNRAVSQSGLALPLSENLFVSDRDTKEPNLFREPNVKGAIARINACVHDTMSAYNDAAVRLLEERYTHEDVSEYFEDMFPSTAKDGGSGRSFRQAMVNLITAPGADFGKGTWWSAFNVVTYLTDHVVGHGDDTRLFSSWYGPNRKTKLKALRKALNYATKDKAITRRKLIAA
jgi:hypothetical protein